MELSNPKVFDYNYEDTKNQLIKNYRFRALIIILHLLGMVMPTYKENLSN